VLSVWANVSKTVGEFEARDIRICTAACMKRRRRSRPSVMFDVDQHDGLVSVLKAKVLPDSSLVV
jgi:hypothetical protein